MVVENDNCQVRATKTSDKQAASKDTDVVSGVSVPEGREKKEKTPDEIAAELFSGKSVDWTRVYSTITTNEPVRKVVVRTRKYLDIILNSDARAPKSVMNGILDNLVELVNDEATLSRFITKRFGVSLKPDAYNSSNTLTFGKNGLKASYLVLQKLPESHVKRLLSLTTDDKSGSSSGVTRNSSRIDLSYNENDVTQTEKGSYTNPGDVMEGMVMFDTTLAHEMGHVADYGERYSRDKSFLKISNWVEYTSPQEVVSTIVSNMSSPFPVSLESKDIKAAEKAAVGIVDKEVTNYSDYGAIIEAEVKAAYQDGILASVVKSVQSWFVREEKESKEDVAKKEEEKRKRIKKKVKEIKGSGLIKHIHAAFASKEPWEFECFDYLPKIQIHQGYENDSWWSYDNVARTGATKNSWYQFREPGEDFAELYSTYYMGSEEKRKQIDPKRRDWFEKTVVKDVEKGK